MSLQYFTQLKFQKIKEDEDTYISMACQVGQPLEDSGTILLRSPTNDTRDTLNKAFRLGIIYHLSAQLSCQLGPTNRENAVIKVKWFLHFDAHLNFNKYQYLPPTGQRP